MGGLKTATQCKQFYDKHYTNKELELTAALEEHSFLKVSLTLKRVLISYYQHFVCLFVLECREDEKEGESESEANGLWCHDRGRR